MYSSSYPNYPADQLFFVHIHILGSQQCVWYSEDGDKFGLFPNALGAVACTKDDATLNIQKLVAIGVPVVEGILIPCDSTEILTDAMRRVLNIA